MNFLSVWLVPLFLIVATSPRAVFADETTKDSHAKIYDESANGAQQISKALDLAKNESKNVFLLFGANWCAPCRKLHAFLESEQAVSNALKNNYIVVPIACGTSQNQDLRSRYAANHDFGLPFIVILGVNGMYLTTKDTTELGDADYSPEKVLAFLTEWAPKTRLQLVHQLVNIYLDHYDQENVPSFLTLQEMSADVVPYLIEVIGTNGSAADEQKKRINAYLTLGNLHSSAKSAIPFLIAQFNTNNNLLDCDAATLGRFRSDAKEAIPMLTNALHGSIPLSARAYSGSNLRLQSDAADTLANIDPNNSELMPKMLIWLKSSNVYCRRVAPVVLGKLGSIGTRAIPALNEALNDEDKTVREHAAETIKKISANTTQRMNQIN